MGFRAAAKSVASLDHDHHGAPVLYLWVGSEWQKAPPYAVFLDSVVRQAIANNSGA